jgi:tetratricopeptide (TPR) repeat protein
MWLRLNFCVVAVLVAALLSAGSSDAADSNGHPTELDLARALIAQGNAGAAYALLEPREFDRAGDIEFDTLLGIAALDSGNPDKATLAFERVLAVDPNAAGARLDMARAYFALGDLARTRQELDVVAQNNPPPAARAVIEKYLAAIAERERINTTVVTGYVEGFAGYDNNITAVVADFGNAVLATYNLAGFQPTGNAVMRHSAVLGGGGGFEVIHQLSDAWSASGAADVHYRNVAAANNYSSEQLDMRGSASYTVGADVMRGGLSLQSYAQRTDVPTDDRNALGINLEWRHVYSDRDQTSLFGVATRQRYPDIAVDDVDSALFGIGWLHLFEGSHKPLLYASVSSGQDNARTQLANGADNSRRYAGGRLYGQWSPNDNIDLFANFGVLDRSDRSMYARSTIIAFGNDRIGDATLGCNWRPWPNWTVRPQATYTENRSNVALSSFHRTEATVAVRYDFH